MAAEHLPTGTTTATFSSVHTSPSTLSSVYPPTSHSRFVHASELQPPDAMPPAHARASGTSMYLRIFLSAPSQYPRYTRLPELALASSWSSLTICQMNSFPRPIGSDMRTGASSDQSSSSTSLPYAGLPPYMKYELSSGHGSTSGAPRPCGTSCISGSGSNASFTQRSGYASRSTIQESERMLPLLSTPP